MFVYTENFFHFPLPHFPQNRTILSLYSKFLITLRVASTNNENVLHKQSQLISSIIFIVYHESNFFFFVLYRSRNKIKCQRKKGKDYCFTLHIGFIIVLIVIFKNFNNTLKLILFFASPQSSTLQYLRYHSFPLFFFPSQSFTIIHNFPAHSQSRGWYHHTLQFASNKENFRPTVREKG